VIDRAFHRVDAASAAVFRIGFGATCVLLVSRFFWHGWIDSLLLAPPRHFSYWGLDWIKPWPAPLMYLHFGAMAVAAAAITLGYRYRIAAGAFFMLFTYVELIDRTLYINHYYWVSLTAALITFLPLHRTWSLDARRPPRPQDETVPLLVVWLLRFQVGMVYVFAGIAKLNADWLSRAQPLRIWLPGRSDLPLLGPLLTLPATAHVLSMAGAAFDLTIVAWLLWRVSRPVAYVCVLVFHAVTWMLFPSIGVFPLLMATGSLVFFPPSWPRRSLEHAPVAPRGATRHPRIAVPLVAASCYVVVLVAIPLRTVVHPTSIDDDAFSWHVLLTEHAGSVTFRVTDPSTGEAWVEAAPDGLTERQVGMMSTDARLIGQAASMIAYDWAAAGRPGVHVTADAYLSVNGRPSVRVEVAAIRMARG
jgi:vitamin K-dependent gamma-carboxylase